MVKIKYILNNKDEDDQHYYKNPNTFKLRKSKKLNFKNKVGIDEGLDLTISNNK